MRFRDIILKFMSPELRAKAEADSKTWIAACPRCQKETSIWDIGGIRYKGTGRPMTMVRCSHCGKANFMRFEKRV
jgi:endogenous inhibitor of DNA gyrase (YacG/DUF329 family)